MNQQNNNLQPPDTNDNPPSSIKETKVEHGFNFIVKKKIDNTNRKSEQENQKKNSSFLLKKLKQNTQDEMQRHLENSQKFTVENENQAIDKIPVRTDPSFNLGNPYDFMDFVAVHKQNVKLRSRKSHLMDRNFKATTVENLDYSILKEEDEKNCYQRSFDMTLPFDIYSKWCYDNRSTTESKLPNSFGKNYKKPLKAGAFDTNGVERNHRFLKLYEATMKDEMEDLTEYLEKNEELKKHMAMKD